MSLWLSNQSFPGFPNGPRWPLPFSHCCWPEPSVFPRRSSSILWIQRSARRTSWPATWALQCSLRYRRAEISVTLLQYFGFRQEPFGATPDPRCLYLSHTHREAAASLEYGFLSNRGFTAMIAPPGMGKTTLLFRFLDRTRESARSVFLFDIDSQCEPQEVIGY